MTCTAWCFPKPSHLSRIVSLPHCFRYSVLTVLSQSIHSCVFFSRSDVSACCTIRLLNVDAVWFWILSIYLLKSAALPFKKQHLYSVVLEQTCCWIESCVCLLPSYDFLERVVSLQCCSRTDMLLDRVLRLHTYQYGRSVDAAHGPFGVFVRLLGTVFQLFSECNNKRNKKLLV